MKTKFPPAFAALEARILRQVMRQPAVELNIVSSWPIEQTRWAV